MRLMGMDLKTGVGVVDYALHLRENWRVCLGGYAEAELRREVSVLRARDVYQRFVRVGFG